MNGISTPVTGGVRALGFQPTLSPAERNHFVPFSENTKGRSGRPVYIDARLLPQFLSLIDVDTDKGRRIVRGIEGLKSIGGGIGSYQSVSRAARHMSQLEDIEVYYFIEQASGQKLPNGLLITGFRKKNTACKDAPGVYWVQSGSAEKSSNNFFSTDRASICAGGRLDEAIEKSEHYTPQNGWGGKDALDLLFLPSNYANEEDQWLSPIEKTADSREIFRKIAHTITETQKRQIALNKPNPIHIQVHGTAINMLYNSLDQCSSHLDKLDFQFVEPIGKSDQAAIKIKAKNGKMSHPLIATTKPSLISLARVRNQLAGLKAKQQDTGLTNVGALTATTSAALNVGRSNSTHSNFLNGVKQANRLGQWGRA